MIMASNLHASLEDPILDSLSFLNEVISKFPNAISFAPGAPNPAYLHDIDIGKYVERYIEYLCQEQDLEPHKARRSLYQYGPARGLINELVAAMLQQDKAIHVAPESLVITVGAQEAMLIVLRALFRSSLGRLAVVTPCFVGILGAARLLDIDVVGIGETEQGINLDELDAACKAARQDNRPIRALYVAPDYSNPAGTILNLEMRQQLLELAERHDFLLLEDNAYGFTAPPGEELPALKALDKANRVIFIGTFAKICLPGARVGYVIADQTVQNARGISHYLAEDLAAIKSMVTVNTSPICQALIGGMLLEQGGSLISLEQERATLYRNNLKLLLSALHHRFPKNKDQTNAIAWNQPTGGFFIRVRIPVPVDMELLKLSASIYGVLWTPMSSFYLNDKGNNELRLSCSYLTPEQIEEGIDRFAAFIRGSVLQ